MGPSLFLHLLVLTVQTSAQYHSEADASILKKMHESSEKHVSDMNGFEIDPELPCGTRCQIKKAMSAWGSLAPMEPQAASPLPVHYSIVTRHNLMPAFLRYKSILVI